MPIWSFVAIAIWKAEAGVGEPAAHVNIWYGPHQNFRNQVRIQHCVKMKLHDKQVLKL